MSTQLLSKADEAQLVEAKIRPSKQIIPPMAQLGPAALSRSAQKQVQSFHKKNISLSTTSMHKK
jgi:hypothetical protein